MNGERICVLSLISAAAGRAIAEGDIAFHNELFAVRTAVADLIDSLYTALPYVEDCEGSVDFKPGVVKKHVAQIKAALARFEGIEP